MVRRAPLPRAGSGRADVVRPSGKHDVRGAAGAASPRGTRDPTEASEVDQDAVDIETVPGRCGRGTAEAEMPIKNQRRDLIVITHGVYRRTR